MNIVMAASTARIPESRPSIAVLAGPGWRWRRRCCRAMRSRRHLVCRSAHQANYVTYPSTGGNSGTMRGYLVQPAGRVRSGRVGGARKPRTQPVRRGCRAACRGGGFLALAPTGSFPLAAIRATTTTAARCREPRPGKVACRPFEQRAIPQGAQDVQRQAGRHRILLRRRHRQLPGTALGRRCTPAHRITVSRPILQAW